MSFDINSLIVRYKCVKSSKISFENANKILATYKQTLEEAKLENLFYIQRKIRFFQETHVLLFFLKSISEAEKII